MTYACPECNGTDLEMLVEVWAKVDQTGDGHKTVIVAGTDHCEPEYAPMRCNTCGHDELAEKFEKEVA